MDDLWHLHDDEASEMKRCQSFKIERVQLVTEFEIY